MKNGKPLRPIVILLVLIWTFSGTKGQDVFDYYRGINRARVLAVDGAYHKSIRAYLNTFASSDRIWARDVVNAAEVSALIENDSLTAALVIQGLKQGVLLSYFKDQQRFENFRSSPHWNSIVEQADQYNKENQEELNQEIRTELNEMFAADQAIREQYYKWGNYPFRPFIGSKWRKLNAEQVERIAEITKTHGFPGEHLIGLDYATYHPKVDERRISGGMAILILIHHFSQPNPSLDSLFLEEVKKGNMYNEHFATVCDYEAQFGKGKFTTMGPYHLRFEQEDTELKEVDEKRKSIGLMTRDEMKPLKTTKVMTRFWNHLY